MPESHAVTQTVADMIANSTGSAHLIETALNYFDQLSLVAHDTKTGNSGTGMVDKKAP